MPEDEDQELSGPAQLREYAERQADEARQAREALAELQRKDMFRDAGLDPTNPLHAAVMNGYKDEADPAKVQQFVESTGVLAKQSAPEPSGPTADEAAALERYAQATAGAPSMPQVSAQQNADIDAAMREMSVRAQREQWTNDRFNAELATLAERRGPTQWVGPIGSEPQPATRPLPANWSPG